MSMYKSSTFVNSTTAAIPRRKSSTGGSWKPGGSLHIADAGLEAKKRMLAREIRAMEDSTEEVKMYPDTFIEKGAFEGPKDRWFYINDVQLRQEICRCQTFDAFDDVLKGKLGRTVNCGLVKSQLINAGMRFFEMREFTSEIHLYYHLYPAKGFAVVVIEKNNANPAASVPLEQVTGFVARIYFVGAVGEEEFLRLEEARKREAERNLQDRLEHQRQLRLAEEEKENLEKEFQQFYLSEKRKEEEARRAMAEAENKVTPVDPEACLAKVRAKVASRAKGFRGLARLFRIMDDNRDHKLDREELRYGIQDCGVFLSGKEHEAVFRYMDEDKDNFVTLNDFLVAMRGPLSPQRRQAIDAAFDVLDADGSGVIQANDIKALYNAGGGVSEDEAFKKFMDNFQRRGVMDDTVTREEFQKYYEVVSANIDDDDDFVSMIRKAWGCHV
eukprot:Rmarinus@m.29243